jgi:hypothetical protein
MPDDPDNPDSAPGRRTIAAGILSVSPLPSTNVISCRTVFPLRPFAFPINNRRIGLARQGGL